MTSRALPVIKELQIINKKNLFMKLISLKKVQDKTLPVALQQL